MAALMPTLYLSLLGLGLMTAILLPLAALTAHRWEPALLRWLERRRRAREAHTYRTALRRPYVG
jgi:hypothetical protein